MDRRGAASIEGVRHAIVLIVLAGCWHSTRTPVAPTPAPSAPIVAEQPTCTTFDKANQACRTRCPQVDPGDWPACIALVAQLVDKGYLCTGAHPRTCVSPPAPVPTCPAGGCTPIKGRVIGIRVVTSYLEVTIGVGSNQGVTTAWTGQLVDASNRVVPNMTVTLVRVDPNVTRGTINGTPGQIQSMPFVLLSP